MTMNGPNIILEHQPVMTKEVLAQLVTDKDGIYVDGTVGLGGHAKSILKTLNNAGHLIGIDRDQSALRIANKNLSKIGQNFSLFNDSYVNTDLILERFDSKKANGILLDLGLSSTQLNDNKRGFSFNSDGVLDMRFDRTSGVTAEKLLANSSEAEIAEFIKLYSEERFAKKIAYNIKKSDKMTTVADLREAIRKSTPPQKRNRSFARVFQAIRIIVNDELNQLRIFLQKFIHLLKIGGRIIILSYHSLEDRMVKQSFRTAKQNGHLSLLNKKPLSPTKKEVMENSRARSAKLRAAEKIG